MNKLMIEDNIFDYSKSYTPIKMCEIINNKVDNIQSCSNICYNVEGNCAKCPVQESFNRLGSYEKLHEYFEQQHKNHSDITWSTKDIMDAFNICLSTNSKEK